MWLSWMSKTGMRQMFAIRLAQTIAWPLLGTALMLAASPALAKPQADAFPPNPLELKPNDPLQPQGVITPEVRDRLQRDLENLHGQALTQLQTGNPTVAFDLWNRELRLSRALGAVAETKTLARVGTIAWEQNQTQQLRYISQRLQQIQANAAQNRDPVLLSELATAYQLIRLPELALNTYRDQIQVARQNADPLAEFQALNAIGQTHLNWFGYKRAAKVYQELLDQARSQNDIDNQIAYLYQLAYVHEQTKNHQAAASTLEALVPLYRAALEPSKPPQAKPPQANQSSPTAQPQPNVSITKPPTKPITQPATKPATKPATALPLETARPNVLAFLEIRLGDSYAASRQFDQAEAAYKSAYKTAQAQVQLGYAGDALRKLAKFYRSQNRFDAAIKVYDFLSSFEQADSQNFYNVMDAFDQMGQTFLQKQEPGKAIAAFQRGLQVAQTLRYRTEYFTDQISQVQKVLSPAPTPAITPKS